MAATQCLTADMLEVGMKYEKKLSFTAEDVAQYCALSRDANAIHADVAAARLRFPDVNDIVVPGGLIQITVTGIFGTEFPGDGTLGLTFTPERFRKPVCPGDEIQVVIEVAKLRRDMIDLEVSVIDAAGDKIGAATSLLIVPDANYRAWWEKNRAQ